MQTAKEVWNIVEEKFRITENAVIKDQLSKVQSLVTVASNTEEVDQQPNVTPDASQATA